MDTPVNGEASPQEKKSAPSVSILYGDSVEIAADIISRLHLCPRDMIALGASLCCAVVDIGNERFPDSSPFRHIQNTEGPERNPFQIAIAVLQEVDSWGTGGAEIPAHKIGPG